MRFRELLSVALLGLGLAVSPVLTASLRADDAPKERPRGGPAGLLTRIRATVDKLNLTSEQRPKIDAAFDDAKSKIQEVVKDNAGADRDAMRSKIQPIIKDLMEKVTAVLTPEQKEQLQKSRENGPHKGQGDKPKTEKSAN